MLNNKKIKIGLIKIAIAISLAFTGTPIFVLGSDTVNPSFVLLSIIGVFMMLGSVFLGFTGIKTIISAFFDETNE